MIEKLISLQATVPQIEVKRASSPIDDFLAPAIQPKGASSLEEDDEAKQRSQRLGQLFRVYRGGV
jgi:hypothetical protein